MIDYDVEEMKMKRWFLLVGSIMLLFAVCLCGCQESTENQNDRNPEYYLYEDTEQGFSIEYPTIWNTYKNPSQVPGVNVLFTSQSNEPTKTGNLMVSVLDNVSLTMAEFKEAHVENLSLLLPDFELVSENSTTLSGLPGYTIVFTFTNDRYTWRQLEVWTISENILYLLVHQADQAYYENFTDDIQHMIESFSIT